MIKQKTGLDTFDHVVVLMLENRSFDNLLGNLYTKDGVPEGKTFEGLQDTDIKMPVPKYASDYGQHPTVSPHRAINYHQPYPDPGEVYPHINTQIYNHIDTENYDTIACKMRGNFNVPDPQPPIPPMNGFIKDYINTMKAIKCEKKHCKECKTQAEINLCKACKSYNDPLYDQYNRIMQVYEPDQVNVLSKLARDFAVFDNWHCSVPSETWPNRAFWHAAASGGKVVNPVSECTKLEDIDALLHWKKHVWSQPNIFERMQDKSITHRVYTQELVALTSMVNGLFNDENVCRDKGLGKFKIDLDNNNLAQYSFIEPKFLGQHNDQHPSAALAASVDGPTNNGSVLLGEHLIHQVYTDIFSSPYKNNTLLIITHDEHGGCFDHVVPPGKNDHVWPPHTPPQVKPEEGFKFDRLGIRVPMVMVSAYIQKNTIINETFDHTSFIKTMSDKYGLDPLTDRDKNANSFVNVFSGGPRDFEMFAPPKLEPEEETDYHKHPINGLQRTIVHGAHFMAMHVQEKLKNGVEIPSPATVKTNGDGLAYLEKIYHLTIFPKKN